MARQRPTFPTTPIPEGLLGSPGFLVAWLADALTDRYDAAMAALKLRSSHHAALLAVHEGGPLRQARLEDRLRVDHATFVATLTELERRGLVRRVSDPDDRRTLLLEITDAGREVVAETWRVVARLESEAFGELSPAERGALVEALAAVVRRVERERLA